MKAFRMEDYKINIRCGCARQTGSYEITKKGTRRAVTRYVETYKTDAGEFFPDEWMRLVRGCVEVSESSDLLERIIEHCRTNCVWLKTDKDREEYALNILIGRTYRNWKDFSTERLQEKTAFVFEFL